jgi:hypothetical protein
MDYSRAPDWDFAFTRTLGSIKCHFLSEDSHMLQNPEFNSFAPDFVQSGPLSHTFGQPFERPVRTIQRIRSLWPFPVKSDKASDSGFSQAAQQSDGDDPTPSSFVS